MADPKDIDWDDATTEPIEWDESTTAPVDAAPSTPPMSVGAPYHGPELRAPERSTWNMMRDVAQGLGIPGSDFIPDEGTARGAVASMLQGPALTWADEAAGLVRATRAENWTDPKVEAQIQERAHAYVAGGMDPAEARQRATKDVFEVGGTLYREGRDSFRNVEGAFRKENPAAAFALTMGSGAALGNPVSVEGGLARYLPALAEGGLAGAGAAAESEDIPEAAAVGAPLGVAGQAFGEVVGDLTGEAARRLSNKFSDAAARYAQRRALAASGFIQKDLKPIMRRNPAEAQRMGQALLDEPGVIQAGTTVSDVADALEPVVEKYGQQIGGILKQADATGAKYDIEPFLSQVETDILAPIRGDPVVSREVGEIDRIVDGYRQLAASKGGLSFSEANSLKSRLQNMEINWGNFFNDVSPSRNAQQYKVHLQNLFLNSIDDQIGQATTPEIAAAFKQAKSQYGTMVDALDKARQGRARMEGNKQFSLTDYLAALGGVSGSVASGDLSPAAAGVGLALANKIARERGPSTMASLGRYLSSGGPSNISPAAMSEAGGRLGAAAAYAQRNAVEAPERRDTTTSDLVSGLVQSNPEALGPYATQLEQAAADGNLPLVHYTLQQKDPQYRRMLDTIRSGGTQ